jgi:glycosyltransferase involved in cell wall biosynthesis
MDWMPNEDGITWFVDDVLPRIHARMPDVTLTIVGRHPPPRIQQLAKQDSRLEVTGSVPDVRPYLERAAAFIVPLRVGGGTRLKIFEALAMELPLVSTTIGAEGLPLQDGYHLVIADAAQQFAESILELLADTERAGSLANAGADYVRSHFGWDRAAARFMELISVDAGERRSLNA